MFQKVMIFDGGFGSELNKYNFPLGTVPEELNITNSDVVRTIHKNYVNAGSDIIVTNTFGANRLKLKNSKYSLKEIILAAIENARSAKSKYVFFVLGPIGQLVEPLGTLKFDEAYDIFKEIVLIAKDHVDGFALETFTDIYELTKNNSISSDEYNAKAIDIMLKYKVVEKKLIEEIISKGKLSPDGLDTVLSNY